LTEKFHCRPRDIFDILMDKNRWKGFTQSNSKIRREVGDYFSLFYGAITGVIQGLQQDKLLVQKWRFENWDDGVFSTITMTFEEPEVGVTIVKLTQPNVPEEDRFGNATMVKNTQLRSENEKLRSENMRYREALNNISCPNCGGPTALGEMSFKKQQLWMETARLIEEIDRISGIAANYVVSPCFHSSHHLSVQSLVQILIW